MIGLSVANGTTIRKALIIQKPEYLGVEKLVDIKVLELL
jgi:hypothetical protein